MASLSSETITESSWHGYVSTTLDALILFEAAKRGHIPKITRRLREDERKHLIRSGAIFIFEEGESGIKRWTDGLLWSPSRILQNFLVYRQIDRKANRSSSPKPAATGSPGPNAATAQPAEGAAGAANAQPQAQAGPGRAAEGPAASASGRDRSGSLDSTMSPAGGVSAAGSGASSSSGSGADAAARPPSRSGAPPMPRRNSDLHRSLVGSLTGSYPFLEKGLCKKTIAIEVGGAHHHLISYYSLEDVYAGRLGTPSAKPELRSLSISPIFLQKSNFRLPPVIEIGPDGLPRYRAEAEDAAAVAIASASASMTGSPALAGPSSAGTPLPAEGSMSKGHARRTSRARAASAASATSASRHRAVSNASPLPHQSGGTGWLPLTFGTASSFTEQATTVRYEPYPSGLAQAQPPAQPTHHQAPPQMQQQDIPSMPYYTGLPVAPPLLQNGEHAFPERFSTDNRPVSASAQSAPDAIAYQETGYLPSQHELPLSHSSLVEQQATFGAGPSHRSLPMHGDQWPQPRYTAPTGLHGLVSHDGGLLEASGMAPSESGLPSAEPHHAHEHPFVPPSMQFHHSEPIASFHQHNDPRYAASIGGPVSHGLSQSPGRREASLGDTQLSRGYTQLPYDFGGSAQQPAPSSGKAPLRLERVVLRPPHQQQNHPFQ